MVQGMATAYTIPLVRSAIADIRAGTYAGVRKKQYFKRIADYRDKLLAHEDCSR